MTKPRVPHSWAYAATRVAGRLGHDAAAIVVGRSIRLIERWTTPGDKRLPSLDQALALDAAYLADGGEEAPFMAAYAAQLDIVVAQATACHQSLIEDAAHAARETGDAVASALAVARPGASPRDVHRAVVEAQEMESAAGRLLRRLISFLPPGAGPGAGKTGGSQ